MLSIEVSEDFGILDPSVIHAWIRHYVSPSGDITFNICRLEVKGTGMEGTYTQALVNTLQATGTQSKTAFNIGDAVPLPTFTIYAGQNADGQPIDAVPPPFPGGDGDGNPGVTIPTVLTGAAFDVHAGLVLTIQMNAVTLTAESEMHGTTSFSTRGTVFDSPLFSILKGAPINVTTDAEAIAFTAKKLDSDGSTPCADIAIREE